MRTTVTINRNGVLDASELQLLVDALDELVVGDSGKRVVHNLRQKLTGWMEKAPSWAPIKPGTIPIKSSWPSGMYKPDRQPRQSKPRQPKPAPKPLTADEIIASL